MVTTLPTRDESQTGVAQTWLQTQHHPQQQEQQQPPGAPQQPQQQSPRSQPSSRQPSLTEAVQTIKPSDFLTFHQTPCSRTGLLTGIGSGAAIGAVRWIMGLPIPRAANWAVGTGALAAIGQYEYCQFQRRQEREKVKRVVEVYGRHQQAQRAKEEAERRAAREQEEKARLEKEEEERRRKGRSWWRLWCVSE